MSLTMERAVGSSAAGRRRIITKQAESMSDAVPGRFAAPPTAVSSIQGAWLLGLLAAVLVLLGLTGRTGRELLRYERAAVLQGEYWRLLTGHLVHGSGQHLLLNAVGLGLIAALFPREYSLRGWLLILASSIVDHRPRVCVVGATAAVVRGPVGRPAWRARGRRDRLVAARIEAPGAGADRCSGGQARLGAVARGAAAFRRHAGRCRCASLWCDRRRAGRRIALAALAQLALRTPIAIIARLLHQPSTANSQRASCLSPSSFPARARNRSACWRSSPAPSRSFRKPSRKRRTCSATTSGSCASTARKSELGKTERTQPAMLAAGVATWRVWRKHGGGLPAAMAGHSLGEYSALVCSGALDFRTAVGARAVSRPGDAGGGAGRAGRDGGDPRPRRRRRRSCLPRSARRAKSCRRRTSIRRARS